MPGSTPIQHLPYPTPDDTVDVPRDVKALADSVDTFGTVPIGAFMMWLTAVAPSGWLFMQGQQVDAATYPGLAALLGQAGGMVTIPDMRDAFPVGAGPAAGLNTTGGAAAVTLTAAQSGMPSHNHGGMTGARDRSQSHSHGAALNDVVLFGGAGAVGFLSPAPGNNFGVSQGLRGITVDQADPADHLHPVLNEAARNATASHENRPPYRAVNFIIRAG
jgi:microcystin-dependent protein